MDAQDAVERRAGIREIGRARCGHIPQAGGRKLEDHPLYRLRRVMAAVVSNCMRASGCMVGPGWLHVRWRHFAGDQVRCGKSHAVVCPQFDRKTRSDEVSRVPDMML